MRYLPTLLMVMATAPAISAPPPPPPEYVWRAGEILSAATKQDEAKIAALFADDVTLTKNGDVIAIGKAQWLAFRAKSMASRGGRTIGYGEGFGKGPGALLVIDTYDTVDRSNLPPNFLADPRMATRATLYEFGKDHLIHAVRISQTDGFWMTPRS